MAPRFPELIRVEASAGSGKTTQLALRYIDLLLNAGAPPSSILAVTFTKKATVEMQDRILLYLKKLAIGEEDVRLDRLPSRPSHEKAAAAVQALLDNFHDFRVSTIDSFLTALARATALENALSPSFEVDLDARGVAGRAMLALLEDYSPATAARHAELEEALAWVLMTQDDVAWDLASVLEKHFTVLRHAETVRNALIEEDEGGADPFALETLLKQAVDARVLGLLNDSELKLRHRSDALRQFVHEGRPLEEIVPLFREADKVFTKGTVERVEGWGEIGALARRLLEIRSRRRLAPSVALHRRTRALFARLQEEGNTLLLDTLQETIRDYIGREGAVPYIYIKLGGALQHYLIDEFQDTSPLQWAVFLPLVEEAVAGAGSLFFVGDVKQAIYGWRGGDYALFHRACQPLALPPQSIELSDNWRSAEAVPKFVASVFARDNLERWLGDEFKEDDCLDGAAVAGHFEPVAQETHRPGGYVRVEPLPAEKGPKDEVDAAILARLAEGIREARRRHPWRNIAVIVRRNAQARMALQHLLQADIPAVSPSALGLLCAPLAREVLAFLRWLDNPVDDLALAGFLLGRMFLGRTGLEAGPLLALLEGRDRSVPLYVSFREAHPETWEEVLSPLFREAGFLPPYDLACRLLAAVDAFERFPGDEAFLYALLELIKDLESEGSNSLGRLLGALREAERNDEDPHPVRMPSGADAVQVLTIHKAKGLEFPAVFIPWAMLDWHPVNDLFVPSDGALRPYRVTKDRVGDLPEGVRREYAQVRTRGLVEELNALYVACTRARDELVVLLPRYAHESQKKRTPIPYEPLEIGRRGPDLPEEAPPPAPPVPKAPRRHGDWQERLVRHAPDLAVLAEPGRRAALERGMERHRAMEAARRFEDLDPRVRSAIESLKGTAELRHEQEIVGPDGRTYRVDLLIRSADRVWVVDYKTGGGDPGKDRAQMRRYLELARPLFPGCAVAGLLAYLDRDAVEAVP